MLDQRSQAGFTYFLHHHEHEHQSLTRTTWSHHQYQSTRLDWAPWHHIVFPQWPVTSVIDCQWSDWPEGHDAIAHTAYVCDFVVLGQLSNTPHQFCIKCGKLHYKVSKLAPIEEMWLSQFSADLIERTKPIFAFHPETDATLACHL